MSIVVDKSSDGKEVRIHIIGRFDFGSHNEFRDAYRDNEAQGTTYILDMAKAEYIDSSALGMILLLKEFAGSQNGSIQIVNTSPEIRNILDIANFGKLFTIT